MYRKCVNDEWKVPSITNTKKAINAERKRVNAADVVKAREWAGLDFEKWFSTFRNSKSVVMTRPEHIARTYRRICPTSKVHHGRINSTMMTVCVSIITMNRISKAF